MVAYDVPTSPSPATTARSASIVTVPIDCETFTGHTGVIRTLRWSPDGNSLVSYSPDDPLRVWSASADTQILAGRVTRSPVALTALAVDYARQIVAAGDRYGALWVWTGDDPKPAQYTLANV